jgi:trehalose 6-phosphate phosphatase
MCRPVFDALSEVGAQFTRCDHLLLCSDFDGTLTQYVNHPKLAGLTMKVRRLLCRLKQFDRITLAVISGREVADLQDRVGIPGLIFSGNHGLEISGPGFFYVEPKSVQWSSSLKKLAKKLATQLSSIEGVLVEDKDLTLSVHYRMAAEADCAEIEKIVERVVKSHRYPLVLTKGFKIFEIRPPIHWNKGSAVSWLQDQLSRQYAQLIYLGCDAADEEVFSAFPRAITIKVGNGQETAARYKVDDPEEVYAFLEWIAEVLDTEQQFPGPVTGAAC